MRICSKPKCSAPGAAILGYDYATRLVVLEDWMPEGAPHIYALCSGCADGLVTPRGWTLADLRRRSRLFIGGSTD